MIHSEPLDVDCCSEQDQLRFIILFLRPEIVEQCAELVQFNASVYEEPFRALIDALCDDYRPFRIWLFARLCSQNRKLVEPQLVKFICFGDRFEHRAASKTEPVRKHSESQSV